jgi:hypothetical protein
MTKEEAAIIMAYTGINFGCFRTFHSYAEKLLGHPIYTHEFASKDIMEKIKKASLNDFIKLHAEAIGQEND